MAANGRPLEALAAAAPLLDDASVRDQARLHAAVATAEALLASGRTGEAIAVTETWQPVAARHREELPLIEPVLLEPARVRDVVRRPARRGDRVLGADLRLGARAPVGPGHGRRGGRARLGLAGTREGPDGAAVLPRERVAAARRRRGRDARLGARRDRPGRGAGRRARAGAPGGDGDGPLAARAQGLRARARARAGLERGGRRRALARVRARARGERARTVARPGRVRGARAARALSPRRSGRGGAGARSPRRPGRRARSRRSPPPTPRRSWRSTEARCWRSPSASRASTRCCSAPRPRTPPPPRTAARAARRAPARRPRARPPGCGSARAALPPTLHGAVVADELTAREREIALLAAGGLSSRADRRPAGRLRSHGRQPPPARVPQARHRPPR